MRASDAVLGGLPCYGTLPGVGVGTTTKSLTVDRLTCSIAPAVILTML